VMRSMMGFAALNPSYEFECGGSSGKCARCATLLRSRVTVRYKPHANKNFWEADAP
jgi:hypothetical protein